MERKQAQDTLDLAALSIPADARGRNRKRRVKMEKSLFGLGAHFGHFPVRGAALGGGAKVVRQASHTGGALTLSLPSVSTRSNGKKKGS